MSLFWAFWDSDLVGLEVGIGLMVGGLPKTGSVLSLLRLRFNKSEAVRLLVPRAAASAISKSQGQGMARDDSDQRFQSLLQPIR